ncbi:hypothetical protein PGT21_018647 [Puccinia graminis f. sp. tritici]|uniref:Uncharacterized protein n=1 Tax=Puccinia graminis f. sp. tritici TaxID=56615 RepID=A0A5B0QV02_PUCGR|nr:hypothetical protein PGT21_018647 [Puccinia graminis f. sp. tritici]
MNLFLADQKVLEKDLNLLTDDLAREYFELKRKEILARRHAKYPQFFSPPSSSIPQATSSAANESSSTSENRRIETP